jgi:uncharacterized protein HemX
LVAASVDPSADENDDRNERTRMLSLRRMYEKCEENVRPEYEEHTGAAQLRAATLVLIALIVGLGRAIFSTSSN